MAGFIATAQTDVAALLRAPVGRPDRAEADRGVHAAGSKVTTTWKIGAQVTWDGEYDGRSYQDKREVLAYDEPRILSVSHYSPMMGQPDEPQNYHTLVYTLTTAGDVTHLELTQDGCESQEQAKQFSHNWQGMLDGLKAHVEG